MVQADTESLRALAEAVRDQSAVIAAGYRATSEILASMADAAQSSASSYDAVEVAFRNQLANFQAAL